MIHSLPASIAIFSLAVFSFLFDLHVDTLGERYAHAIAPLMFDQKELGSAFQRAALRDSDLLPFHGSSELLIANRYHPSTLFGTYPSGFTTFPVAKVDTTCLIVLQRLAALGESLRGKKVVIALTPGNFYKREMVEAAPYAGNFSALHANELVFSSDLSFRLKQNAARRMLQYRETLAGDMLLELAAMSLADDSWTGHLLYYACVPLGKIRNVAFRLQDQWETYKFIVEHPKLDPTVSRQPARLDWPGLLASAEREYGRRATNNPFGIENFRWTLRFRADADQQKGKWPDPVFLERLERAQEWTDLELLLQGLNELGARPLILSMPIHDAYAQHTGTTAVGRAAYYQRLRQTIGRYSVPFLDFAEHGRERLFLADPSSHLGDKGWVVVDRVLDAFYFDLLN
jgi:D-alanine transfer protein